MTKSWCSVALSVVLTCSASAQTRTSAVDKSNFENATHALAQEDYPAVERGFEAVLKDDPKNIPALGNLGIVYSRTRQYALAMSTYRRALELSPHNPGLLLNIGLLYLKESNYKEALPYFQELHARQPHNTQATTLLGTALIFSGQAASGLQVLKPLEQTSQDPAVLYLLGVGYSRTGQTEAGREVFARLLGNATTPEQSNFLMGRVYYDSTRFKEAEAALLQVEKADPTYPGVHLELGKVYISLQQYPDAERELHEAIKQDPRDASAIYYLGGMLVQTTRYAESIPYLEQAKEMLPDSWAPDYYLGKVRFELGQNQEAIALLQQAAQRNDSEASVFYLLAQALRAVGRKQEASAAMTRVAQMHLSALEVERKALKDAGVVSP